MKETTDRRRTPSNTQSKRSAKTEKMDRKPHQTSTGKETESKSLHAKPDSGALVSGLHTGSEATEVYENLVIHYMGDNVNKLEEATRDPKANTISEIVEKSVTVDDVDKESKQGKEEESDTDTIKDSVSSHEDSVTADDEKVERIPRVPKRVNNKDSENSRKPRVKSDSGNKKSQPKAASSTPKKPTKPNKGPPRSVGSLDKNFKDMKVSTKPSSESSEAGDDKPVEEAKDDVLDETSNGTHSIASDNEIVDAEENGDQEDETALNQKIEEMEMRLGKLEEELREVAALEISLYSVVPEHGFSAHKVHTPARRLSRLYLHACKHWTQDK